MADEWNSVTRFIRPAVLPQQVTNGFDWIGKVG
jgi:hypothetical protein